MLMIGLRMYHMQDELAKSPCIIEDELFASLLTTNKNILITTE